MSREILSIILKMCINTETLKPFPFYLLENALTQSHYSVSLQKNAKQQALEVIKIFKEQQILPIERNSIRLQILLTHSSSCTYFYFILIIILFVLYLFFLYNIDR